MTTDKLTAGLLSDTRLSHLTVELQRDALEVVIHSLSDDSVIHRRIPLVYTEGTNVLPQIEEAIYDNPLLLGDFGKVDFLVDTDRFTIVPDGLSEETKAQVMETLWPVKDYTVVDNVLASSGTALLMAVEAPHVAFVRRTYPSARIQHRLTPMITYFYNKERLNNATRMYVHVRQSAIDVVYLSNGRLKLANTYPTPTEQDMLYYVMAVARAEGFVMDRDVIMLSGASILREMIAPYLRRYVANVLPVVFPSGMVAIGQDAVDSPFELIILPQCE